MSEPTQPEPPAQSAQAKAALTATVAVSGRQYRVREGDSIVVNRMPTAVGKTTHLKPVLLIETADGEIIAPASRGGGTLPKAAVSATVDAHLRGTKLRVFKMRRRKASRRTNGHRQDLTRLRIKSIRQP